MKTKPKILVLIDWYTPAYRAGGPIKSMRNLVDNLSQYFDFYILTSNEDFGGVRLDVEHSRWMKISESVNIFYVNKRHKPLAVLLYQMKNTSYDLLLVNGMYSFLYSIVPLLYARNKPVIVFPRGMLSEHSIASKSFKKRVFVSVAQKLPVYHRVHYAVTSSGEQEDVSRLFPGADVIVVPNFVSRPKEMNFITKKKGELRLVSLARVSQVKNFEFALDVLRHDFDGKIIYDIYGQYDDKQYLRKLLEKVRHLPGNIEVNFKGGFGGDTHMLLSEYHFLISTTQGENFGHAIYESFAAGRPVIISNNTPWRNLQLDNIGWDLNLDKNEFREVLAKCLAMDNGQYKSMSVNAWKFANQYYERNKRNIQALYFKFVNIIKNQ